MTPGKFLFIYIGSLIIALFLGLFVGTTIGNRMPYKDIFFGAGISAFIVLVFAFYLFAKENL